MSLNNPSADWENKIVDEVVNSDEELKIQAAAVQLMLHDKLYAERDESEEEDNEREDAIMSWSAVLNGQNRETLSRLTLALSRQLHTLAVKAYADNFAESDIPTLRRLAQLPTSSPAVLTLFYREEDDV